MIRCLQEGRKSLTVCPLPTQGILAARGGLQHAGKSALSGGLVVALMEVAGAVLRRWTAPAPFAPIPHR